MPEPSFMQRLLREKTLSRYLTALERGNIDVIIAILQQSSEDAVLEQMIFELHESYQAEEEFLALVQEEQDMEIEGGIHKSQPGRMLPNAEEEPELTPVPARKSRRPARWLQALAAVLLVCIVGGGFLFLRLHLVPHNTPLAAKSGWCSIPTIGLRTNIGAPALRAVTAVSANDIWMAGYTGGRTNSDQDQSQTLIEHWDGSRLIAMPSPNAGENGDKLMGMVEVTPNDVWAVGSVLQAEPRNTFLAAGLLSGIHTLIEHWDGQKWSIVPSPDGKNGTNAVNELRSIAAISANDIWAVGDIGLLQNENSTTITAGPAQGTESVLVEHWNGRVWSVVQLPTSLRVIDLDKIVAAPGGDLWASGDTNSGSLLLRWHNQQWSSVRGLDANLLVRSLVASATDDIWTAGEELETNHTTKWFIAHWDGAGWQEKTVPEVPLLSPAQSGQEITAFTATSFNNLWAVGGELNEVFYQAPVAPLLAHWNGKSWQKGVEVQKYTGNLSVIAVIGSKIWAAGTIYTGLQQVPGQLVETSC